MHLEDRMSRHRGAKHRRQYELSCGISLLSLASFVLSQYITASDIFISNWTISLWFASLANSYSLLSLWSSISNRTYGWPIAHFFFQKKRRGTGFSVIQTIHCVYQYTHGHAKLLTFISWAMAYPFRTTGSLSPTCVPARLISLTVKHVYAFTLHLALHSQLVSI